MLNWRSRLWEMKFGFSGSALEFCPFFINAYHLRVIAPKYLSNLWAISRLRDSTALLMHLFIPAWIRRVRSQCKQLPVVDINRTKLISRYFLWPRLWVHERLFFFHLYCRLSTLRIPPRITTVHVFRQQNYLSQCQLGIVRCACDDNPRSKFPQLTCYQRNSMVFPLSCVAALWRSMGSRCEKLRFIVKDYLYWSLHANLWGNVHASLSDRGLS